MKKLLLIAVGSALASVSYAAEKNLGILDKKMVVGTQIRCEEVHSYRFNAKEVKNVNMTGEAKGGQVAVDLKTQGGSSLLRPDLRLSGTKISTKAKLNPNGPGNYFLTVTPKNCRNPITYKIQFAK